MNSISRIAVIGGTGKSGKYLTDQLLKQALPFRLLLRNPANFQLRNPLMEIVQGDARNYDSVLRLLQGCDAVLSTLGQPKDEPSIFSDATRNILKAMHACSIQRYIVTTGLNVDTPEDAKSPQTRFATDWMKNNYPKTTLDKQVEWELLSESDVDWTLVRLPMIKQTDERGNVIVSLEDCPGDGISAADLACFMIDQLSDDTYVKKAPFIATGDIRISRS